MKGDGLELPAARDDAHGILGARVLIDRLQLSADVHLLVPLVDSLEELHAAAQLLHVRLRLRCHLSGAGKGAVSQP